MLLTRTLLASTATLPRTEVSEAELSSARIRVVRRQAAAWWGVALAALTLMVLFVHGFHPLAEDGGLYIAGVEWRLNSSLFPRFTEFVSEHVHFSIFAPVVAAITRATNLSLLAVLFIINLLSIVLTLAAAHLVLRRVTPNERAQLAGIATLGAVWTMPIAGTSLLLMDPCVTARSLSTPLSVWAIAFALDDWRDNRRSLAGCILAIALAAAFHPLMAGYALGLIIVLRLLRSRRKILLLAILAFLTFAAAAILQARAPAESAAVILAAESRYYWFLSHWHWYELFGLLGPLLVLLALRRYNRFGLRANGALLCDAAILYGCFATALALAFGQRALPRPYRRTPAAPPRLPHDLPHHVSAAWHLDATNPRACISTVLCAALCTLCNDPHTSRFRLRHVYCSAQRISSVPTHRASLAATAKPEPVGPRLSLVSR